MSKSTCRFAVVGDPGLNQTSAHGGALLWLEALRLTGAFHRLPVQVCGAQGWTDGQMMLAVALLNVVGYEHVSDVDALEEDASLCRLVREYEPELFGLSAAALAQRFRGGRGRTFPSANSVHDWLLRFQDEAAGKAREKGQAVGGGGSRIGPRGGNSSSTPFSGPKIERVISARFRDSDLRPTASRRITRTSSSIERWCLAAQMRKHAFTSSSRLRIVMLAIGCVSS